MLTRDTQSTSLPGKPGAVTLAASNDLYPVAPSQHLGEALPSRGDGKVRVDTVIEALSVPEVSI